MKPKKSNIVQFLTVCLAPAIIGMTLQSAHAASATWTGGASTNVINTGSNWSTNAVPSGAGDTATWNGTQSGALSLTATAGWSPASGNSGGVNIAATSGQTSSLSIAGTGFNLGLGNVTVQSGAGAVTINPAAQLVFRGGNATLTNNSSNALTFGSSISNWNNGGGADRTVTFGGSGNTQINGNFILGGQGNFTTVTKSGAGTLTFNGAKNGQDTSLGNAIASLVISEGTVKFGSAAQLGLTGGFGTYATGITDNGTLEWGSSASQTLSGVISGNGSLKQSAGSLTLSGSSTYIGATTINGGTLNVSGSGNINSTSGITVNGANAKYLQTSSTASTRTIALTQGTVGGTGTIGTVNVGAGTGGIIANGNSSSTALAITNLNFSGAGAFGITEDGDTSTSGINVGTMTTTPATGTVTVNASQSSWNSGVTYNLVTATNFSGSVSDFTLGTIAGKTSRQSASLVLNGGTLGLQIIGDSPKWTGSYGSNWQVGSTSNWQLILGGSTTDYINGDVVLFDDTASSTTVNISAANVSPGVITFDNSSRDYTLTGDYGIASGSITKNGTGTLTIGTPNTYTIGTTVNAGTVALSGSGTLGASAPLTAAGGTVDLGATSQTIGALSVTGQALIQNGTLTATGVSATNAGVNAEISASLSLGSGSVSKSGSGVLTLSGANTYTGSTTINGGSLALSGSGTLGGASSSITLSGGSLDLGTTSQNSNAVTISAAAGSGDTLTNGSITPSALTVSAANSIVSVSANILGSTGITFSGGVSTLNLTGNNTYGGPLNINGPSTVAIAGSNSGGGAVNFNSFGATFTINSGSYSTSGFVSTGNSNSRFINLNGGVLTSGNIFASTLATEIVFNGGTLKAGSSAGITVYDFNNQLTVNASGATFDTSIGNITLGNNTISSNLTKIYGTAGGTVTLSGGKKLVSGISNTGTLAIQDGSNWDLNGIASSVGGLSGDGTITDSGAAAVLTVASSSSSEYTGIIAGGTKISLVKLGTGTQTLSGVNTYQGNTTINAGTLAISNNSATTFADTSTITIASGAVLDLPNDAADVVTSLVINGVVLAPGIYGASSPETTGYITGLGTIQVGSPGDTWTGLDNSNWVASSTGGNENWKLNIGGTPTPYYENDTVFFSDTATYTTVTISDANVNPAATNFNNSSNSYSIDGSFGIASGSVNKSGSGNVTIATANSYTGATTVNAGTLTLSGAGTLGATTAGLTLTGGTVDLGSTSQTVGSLTIADKGLGVNDATTAAVIQNGTLTASGLSATRSSANAEISSSLNLGTGSVSKSGSSILTLSGTTTYTGSTTINGGTLALSNLGSLGSTSGIMFSGGSLDLGTTSQTTTGITISAAAGSGDTIKNGSITPSSFTFSAPSGIATVSANILGNIGITTYGAGTLRLTGNNTFSGPLNFTGVSTVMIESGSNSGGGAVTYNSTGSNVTLSGGSYTTSGFTSSNESEYRYLNLNGGNLISAGNVFADTLGVSIAFSGGTLTAGSAGGITVFDANNQIAINSGGATFDTTTGNIRVGNNTHSIAASNQPTLVGTTGGAITLRGGKSLATGINNNGSVAIQDDSNWDLNGISSSVVSISGNGTITNEGTAATLVLNVAASKSATYAGTIAGGAKISLIKQGAGTQTLEDNNADHGDTTVAQGTLVVNGGFADTSTVAIYSDAVLNLPNAGTDIVASLVLNGVVQPDGVYDASTAGGFITGSGKIQVGNAAVADTVAPVITLNGNSTATVEAGGSYTDVGASATDNVDSSVSVTTSGSVDTAIPGTYTLYYNATDAAGNHATQVTRTVTVSDTTAPVITRNGNATVSLVAGGSYTDAGATATDSLDGSVTVTTSGTVNTAVAGTYTLTYSATDAAGNQATQVTRTVTVTAPTFSDWASGYSLTGANAAADADPDKDGIKNSVEYVLGGNPTVSDAATIAPTGAKSGSNYVYTFKRTDVSEANTTVSVEYGNNLSGWTSYSVGATTSSPVVVTENDTAADTVVVTIPNAGAAKFFARLKVIVP